MPWPAWNRHSNAYVPAGRLMVADWLFPPSRTTSMFWPVTVKVWDVSEAFTILIVPPLATDGSDGPNLKFVSLTVTPPPPPAGGLEPPPPPHLLHAAPT